MISVIIPVYNASRFIPGTYDNLQRQQYRDFEAVFVDDGSTDDTAEVIKNLGTEFPIRYHYKQNEGPGIARNYGIRRAHGDIIAFLDADDIWAPSKLQKQVELLEEKSDLGAVFTNACYRDSETGKDMGCSVPRDLDLVHLAKELMTRGCFMLTSTVMVRKIVFDTVGLFDEDLTFAEDWDLFFRIAVLFNIGCVDDVLVEQCAHRGSITSDETRRQKRIRDEQRVVEKMYVQENKYGLTASDKSRMLQKLMIFNARRCIYNGNIPLARKMLRDALTYNLFNYEVIKLYAYCAFLR